MSKMTKYLDGGITPNGEGQGGTAWTILGQRYLPKASCASTFARCGADTIGPPK